MKRGNVLMDTWRVASVVRSQNKLGGSYVKKSEGAELVYHTSESSNDIVATSSPEKHWLWYFCWFCVFGVQSFPALPPLSPGDGVARSIHLLVALLETLTGGEKKKRDIKWK